MIEQFFQARLCRTGAGTEAPLPGMKPSGSPGGSKLNATPTRTDKKIAISLQDLELDWVDWDNGALRIGAMSRLQPLRDARFIPAALREALGFVYSRHVRNQSTIGGEIAARQEESVLLPVLLALDAELVFWQRRNAVNRGLPWPAHAIAC